jgi:hypothetical protein
MGFFPTLRSCVTLFALECGASLLAQKKNVLTAVGVLSAVGLAIERCS